LGVADDDLLSQVRRDPVERDPVEGPWADLTDAAIVRSRVAAAVAGGGWNHAQGLYTPEWRDATRRIRSGHTQAIEAGVVFLEVDPWCFASGYEKEDLYRLLAHAPLDEAHKARLREVVLRRLADPCGRSRVTLRRLAHLANAVWTPELHQAMARVPRSPRSDYAELEARFLVLAMHGQQSSVKWGVNHIQAFPDEDR